MSSKLVIQKKTNPPLWSSPIQQQSSRWSTALGWGLVTLAFGGVTGFGAYSISHSKSTDTLERRTAISLVVAASLAALYALGKTLYSLNATNTSPVSSNWNDLTLKTQQQILARLAEVSRKYGQPSEEGQDPNDVLDLIEKKITLLDELLETTVADRDRHRTSLEKLEQDFAAFKTKFQQQTIKSPVGLANAPTPTTPNTESLDFEELQRRLLEDFEGLETRVKAGIATPPSGQGTPGTRTPISLTPLKRTVPKGSSVKPGSGKVLFDVAKTGSANS